MATPKQYKDKFLKSLGKDSEIFFKRLFKVLDRLEDKEKAIYIGRLFRALIESKISVNSFKQLSSIIDRAYVETLKFISNFDRVVYQERARLGGTPLAYLSRYEEAEPELLQLMGAGLVVENSAKISTISSGQNEFERRKLFLLSDLGEAFYNYSLNAGKLRY